MIPVEKFREYKAGELLGQMNETERVSVNFIRGEIWNTPANLTSITIATPNPTSSDVLTIKTYYELLGFHVYVNYEHLTITISWAPSK